MAPGSSEQVPGTEGLIPKLEPMEQEKVVVQPGIDKLNEPAAVPTAFPLPHFAKATLNQRKQKMPQCIAHRGYRAKFPENTLVAFEEAVKIGAQGLETDVRLTADGVVVLSHDEDLKRSFGRKDKIVDKTWDELKDLRTLAPPHVPLPRLEDLLDLLTQPDMKDVWLLVDVKLGNDTNDIMRELGATMDRVKQPPGKPWRERVALGLWAAKYLPLAEKHLPGYPVIHIGFTTWYAHEFLKVPNLGFNVMDKMLVAPGGTRFISEAKDVCDRQVIAWTVNNRQTMEWCIRRRLDGIVTDEPKLFAELREDFDVRGKEPWFPLSIWTYLEVARLYVFCMWFLRLYRDNKIYPFSPVPGSRTRKLPK